MRIIGKRITDRRFKVLIGRFLKGGLINEVGGVLPSELRTPQGIYYESDTSKRIST